MGPVPKLWTDTVEEHRQAVREATLDATARLVAERGLTSVTMSAIATEAGIGRATLYKYFPDVETILVAWHERQVSGHLEHLARIRDQASPGQRLEAVLEAYALMTHDRPHGTELTALLHRGEHVAGAHQRLAGLDTRAAGRRGQGGPGPVRRAAGGAGGLLPARAERGRGLPSRAAVGRLVAVTLACAPDRWPPARLGDVGAMSGLRHWGLRITRRTINGQFRLIRFTTNSPPDCAAIEGEVDVQESHWLA